MDTDTLDIVETLSPLDALEEFIANVVKPGVQADRILILKMIAGEGTLTRLDVALDLDPNDLSNWVYGGVTTIQYNRIDLADFFSGIPLSFNPPSFPTTTAWLCEQIATIGQIRFDASDFVQESITEEMAINYYLKADPNSYRFVGQVPVSLYKQTPLVKYFIQSDGTVLSNMGNMASITQDYGVGINSRLTNGTILGTYLVGLTAGFTFTVPLGYPKVYWDLFNRVLNQPSTTWVIDSSGPGPYNGYGSTVTYNGPIDPESDKPYNTKLTQVCRIQLNSSYCTNQDGVLNIYYSLARAGN